MKGAFVGIWGMLALLGCPVAQAQEATTKVAATAEKSVAPDAGAQLGSVATTGGAMPLSLAVAVASEMAVPPLPPPITLTLKVDLGAQKVTVLDRGKVMHVWTISSGRQGYATQTGTFRPQWAAKMWYSRQWDMAPMPHAVFFNGGTAFHATNAVGALGRPASHGCIRLAPANAAALYTLVHRHGYASTKVIVHGAPKAPAVARKKPKPTWQSQEANAGGGNWTPRSQRAKSPGNSIWGF